MSKKLFELIVMLMKKCQLTETRIRNEFGLSVAEYNALLTIGRDEKMLCNAFSEKMGISASRGSRIIDRLTKKGFVKGEAVPDDRRILKISMTDKGIELKGLINKKMEECENNILGKLSKQQREDVRGALEMLSEIM
ncbi:MAG: MarR family transcriptional regulator [candidate division WOR-3 bacterium]|nr:MAG: MarR family transcriptional regulator [candidate division WOR-3 bacterium]